MTSFAGRDVFITSLSVTDNAMNYLPSSQKIQGDDIDTGASLRDLQDAMEKRSFNTKTVHASQHWLRENWDGFAIAHCKTKFDHGHFIVYIPESSGGGYWDGLRGHFSGVPSDLTITGSMLLISKEAIATSPSYLWRQMIHYLEFLGIVLVSTGLVQYSRDWVHCPRQCKV